MLAPHRSSDSSSQLIARGRTGLPRRMFLCGDSASTARLAEKADDPGSKAKGGLGCRVHTHIEGMSKGMGCASEKWSPKGEVTKHGFSSVTCRDRACAPGSMGRTENASVPAGGVAGVKGGGWRETFTLF